jgi:hypothetical protein
MLDRSPLTAKDHSPLFRQLKADDAGDEGDRKGVESSVEFHLVLLAVVHAEGVSCLASRDDDNKVEAVSGLRAYQWEVIIRLVGLQSKPMPYLADGLAVQGSHSPNLHVSVFPPDHHSPWHLSDEFSTIPTPSPRLASPHPHQFLRHHLPLLVLVREQKFPHDAMCSQTTSSSP